MSGLAVYVCLLVMVILAPEQGKSQCIMSVKEGSPVVLTCSTGTTVTETFRWQLLKSGAVTDLTTCYLNSTCMDSFPSLYAGELTSNVNTAGTRARYVNELLIRQASRQESEFSCLIDNVSKGGSCHLDVYVPPMKPTCDTVALDNSMTKANITCRTSRVYPDAYTQIIYDAKGLPENITISRSCKKSISPIQETDFMVECSTLFPLSGASPGPLYFVVTMVPKLSDALQAIIETAVSDHLDPLFLTAPTTKITNCPVGSGGYIMSGSTATCKCELDIVGFPPGQAVWYTSSGKSVGTVNAADRSSTLTLTYSLSDQRPTFKCAASTLLTTPEFSVSLTAEFAYGPSAVYSKDQSFDLCPTSSQSTRISCEVPFNLVHPSVKFTTIVNNEVLANQTEGVVQKDAFVFVQIYRPTRAGTYSITCTALNSVFPQLWHDGVSVLRVREPPASAPVIWSGNGQAAATSIDLTEGDDAAIFCRVDGGVPQVSETTLTCGSFTNIAQNRIVTLSIRATKSLNGLICFCSASHVTGCYDKSSNVTINIQETNVTIENRSIMIIVTIGACSIAFIAVVISIIAIASYCKHRKIWLTKKNKLTEENVQSNNIYLSPITPSIYQSNPGGFDDALSVRTDNIYDVLNYPSADEYSTYDRNKYSVIKAGNDEDITNDMLPASGTTTTEPNSVIAPTIEEPNSVIVPTMEHLPA